MMARRASLRHAATGAGAWTFQLAFAHENTDERVDERFAGGIAEQWRHGVDARRITLGDDLTVLHDDDRFHPAMRRPGRFGEDTIQRRAQTRIRRLNDLWRNVGEKPR